MNKNSTRYFSSKQEKDIAKKVGGKLQSNSGATTFSKGDVKIMKEIEKKLKCKKEYGIWYYTKMLPTHDNDLRFPIYVLHNEQGTDGGEFGSYGDMKYYVETGINLG